MPGVAASLRRLLHRRVQTAKVVVLVTFVAPGRTQNSELTQTKPACRQNPLHNVARTARPLAHVTAHRFRAASGATHRRCVVTAAGASRGQVRQAGPAGPSDAKPPASASAAPSSSGTCGFRGWWILRDYWSRYGCREGRLWSWRWFEFFRWRRRGRSYHGGCQRGTRLEEKVG